MSTTMWIVVPVVVIGSVLIAPFIFFFFIYCWKKWSAAAQRIRQYKIQRIKDEETINKVKQKEEASRIEKNAARDGGKDGSKPILGYEYSI